MISSDGIVVSVADVLSMSGERSMFVRPDEDSKAFNGGLFDKAALQSVMSPALEKGRISVDTQVVIARPRTIDAEWRIFIVDRQVVAASSYRWNGVANIDLHVPHRVIALAFEAIELWTPADVFCLDIALASERYGIVEANCFNAARFYGADAGAIVGAVSSFARSTFRVRR